MLLEENERIALHGFALGDWMTNCYAAADKSSGRAWLFDPGFSPEPAVDFLKEEAWEPEKIFLTHGHLDHIGGLTVVREAFPRAQIYVHALDSGYYNDPGINLSAPFRISLSPPPPDILLQGEEVVESGALSCKAIHCPGHSPGGLAFFFENDGFLISGDTLFRDSVGRWDFPHSDGERLFRSLREKLLVLPEKTRVYPGHGPATTIGRERSENRFVR